MERYGNAQANPTDEYDDRAQDLSADDSLGMKYRERSCDAADQDRHREPWLPGLYIVIWARWGWAEGFHNGADFLADGKLVLRRRRFSCSKMICPLPSNKQMNFISH